MDHFSSLIRYPGGKTRAIPILKTFLPPGIRRIYAPFFGGGSFELYCAKYFHMEIIGNDIYGPVFNLFDQLKKSKTRVVKYINTTQKPKTKEEYKVLLDTFHKTSSLAKQAALFFILNRCAFNGWLTKGFSPRSCNDSMVDVLSKFDMSLVTMKNEDFTVFLASLVNLKDDALIFLDPPYYLDSAYYGEKQMSFDHESLAKCLSSRFKNKLWMLCYNDCKEIRGLYKKNKIVEVDWYHGMANHNERKSYSKEIVILSEKLRMALKM